jgi:hypothetical protein
MAIGFGALAMFTATTAIAAAPQVVSVPLPHAAAFYSIEPDGRELLLTGQTRSGANCAWVLIDPTTLRARRMLSGDCERPRLSAHLVSPVIFPDPHGSEQRVKIARRDPHTGRLSYGPVVMRFADSSTSRLQWAYGPGHLWLFDALTPSGPQVVQVSAVSGRVQNRVAMPRIFRPLLAADSDGLWLAIATNGGIEGNGPAPLYRVALNAQAATLVHRGGRAALWLIASGHTVWTDIISGTTRQELWRFNGPKGTARALARADRLHAGGAAVEPGAGGLWTLSDIPEGGKFFSCSGEHVIRIDAGTGQQSVIATIHVPQNRCAVQYGAPTNATYTNGASYFIVNGDSQDRLYRVRP